MSITITSTKIKTYQNYTLYRWTDKNVWGMPLMTNTTGVFVDTPPLDNTLYYYGIEGWDTDPTASYREPVNSIMNRSDWGPFTSAVTSNLNASGTPFGQGSFNNGMFCDKGSTEFSMPTISGNIGQTKLDTWGAAAGSFPVTMFRLVAGESAVVGAGVCAAGSIWSISPASQVTYYTGGLGSVTQVYAANAVKQYSDYVNALSDGSSVVTINGYKWQYKILTASQFPKILRNLAASTYVGPEYSDYCLMSSGTLVANTVIPGDASATALILNASSGYPTTAAPSAASSQQTWTIMTYFEYIGRA